MEGVSRVGRSGVESAQRGIQALYQSDVNEDRQRLDEIKTMAWEQGLHQARIPVSDDLTQKIFSHLKLRSIYDTTPQTQIHKQLRDVEEDPRWKSFSTSPLIEKGGIKRDDPTKFTQPISAQGRAVHDIVHKKYLHLLASERRPQLQREPEPEPE